MKILLTGMTAPHTSRQANTRALSFAGQVRETLSLGSLGDDVTWADPSITAATLGHYNEFDLIIVGLAPFTALGATRAYGALHLINTYFDDPRLRLFIDAPNPAQITHSFQSILKHPENMLKAFYKIRQGYQEAQDPAIRLSIYTAIRRLATESWPTTVYPKLPWDQEDLEFQLPEGALGHVNSVNLDAVSLRHKKRFDFAVEPHWVADDLKSKWTSTTESTLSYPVVSMKRNKFSADSEVDKEIASSVGVLISPTKRGRTWWTYRVAQSLRLGTPVITEWRDSGVLGPEWQTLAAQVEHMSDERRAELAQAQLLSYSTAVGNTTRAYQELQRAFEIEDSTDE